MLFNEADTFDGAVLSPDRLSDVIELSEEPRVSGTHLPLFDDGHSERKVSGAKTTADDVVEFSHGARGTVKKSSGRV
jgi:hypothetical protein